MRKRSEFKQRLVNCRVFLQLAWLALWSDSKALAYVMVGSFTEDSEDIIRELRGEQ